MYRVLCFSFSCFISITLFAQDDNDCFEAFFSTGEKPPSTLRIVQKGSAAKSIAQYLKGAGIIAEQRSTLKDLDGDGQKELVLFNYTGGAHCCDEFYILKQTAKNQYNLSAKLYAGLTCVDKNNVFTYDLYEMFGYFFTCYACLLSGDSTSGITTISAIELSYNNGKFVPKKGTDTQLETIQQNLKKIGALKYDGAKELGDQDDGRRKDLALNLAVHYFSFGKNMAQTKKLFDTYYRFKDAPAVWKQFVQTLDHVIQKSGL